MCGYQYFSVSTISPLKADEIIQTMMLVLLAILIATAEVATSFRATLKTNDKRQQSYLSATLGPEDFIRLTKEYLSSPSVDKLADDYVFRGPVVGPLVKKVTKNYQYHTPEKYYSHDLTISNMSYCRISWYL